MSRRRFFHPAQTYNSFIHSVEEYKHSREPSTSSLNTGDVQLSIQPPQADLTDPSAASPLLPPASPSRPLSPLQSHSLLPFSSVGQSSASHTAKHGDHIDIWLSRRNLDAVIKRKSLLIFLNGLFGILLQIVLLQVGWDGQEYHDDDRAGELPVLLSIKIAMFLSSCLLVYQLLDRKQMQITIKYREKRRKIRSLVKPPLSTVSLISLLSLRPSSFRWKLWLQCIICFFHPFPFFHPRLIPLHMSNKLGLLMFLRLHLVFRVIRDYSEIWLNRRSIKKLTAFSSRTPNFDWWLSVKTMVYRNPIIFATSFYLFCILVFGYSVYIFEREVQPDLFSLLIGFYLAFQCITIDWASDVYDVYDPITWAGKLTCLTAAMMGLLLTSFIIGIVSQSILPSKFEEMALNCLAEGTLVAMADGTSVPIEKVQEGAAVLSYHAALAPGEEEGLIGRQVDDVLDRGRRECVELVFSDGRSLVCTPDHRIRTADGRWVEAQHLKVKCDEVAVGVEHPNSTAGVEGAGAALLEDDDGEDGDTNPYVCQSVDKVTHGVHCDARVLPLFRAQLVVRRAVGKKRVWDLSVPSPQGDVSRSFVANGVVVHNCISVEKAREKEKDNAARLIQYVWRNYRHEKELAEKLERKNPRLYEEISALEEKEFMEEFLARSKSLRNVRRERVDLEEQLMGGQRAEGTGGGTGGGGGGKLSGGGGGDDVVERVERLVERVVEQQEEMMRWMRSLYKEKEKRKGRRDRERQKRRKRDEEERKQREEKQDEDGAQQQQPADMPNSQPSEEQRQKRSRKSMRRGRGEAEAEEAVNADAIGEVDENGVVRPANSGAALGGTGGRRRSISYGELRDLEKWGEEGASEQTGEGDEVRRRADDGDRKETEGGAEQHEQDDVLSSLVRPPPLTASTSASTSSSSQPTAAASSIAPLSSFRPPSSFPTLPSLGAQPRSFSLPLSAFSLFAKPQQPAAHFPLASPLASLALASHSQPPSAASVTSSSSISAPVSASSSPLRVARAVPVSSAAVDSHDDDEKRVRRARERPREQDIARGRARPPPAAEQREQDEHRNDHDNELDEALDTSLSDATDGENTATGLDEAGGSQRGRWRERERTRERRRRVRSLSPHSVALAQMAISAMTGGSSSSSRRRTERKDEAEGTEASRSSRRRSTAAADRDRERSRGGGGGGRDRDRRSLLSASFSTGDAATQRRASISGPVMRMSSRGEGGGGAGGDDGEEERGNEQASGSDRSGRERNRTGGPSGRHKP